MNDNWVLDVTNWHGLKAWCPLDEDGAVVVGLTVITDRPPNGEIVGIVHFDGQDALDAWCEQHKDVLDELGVSG